jgi:Lipocalin-like domain
VKILSGVAIASLVLSQPSEVWAQQKVRSLKDRLVGSWSLVSNYQQYPDGTKTNIFGENQKGNVMFDRRGRFSFHIYNPDRPKFASNNRMEGTAEENKRAVQSTIAYYGTYSVNEKDSMLTYHIEYCTFPNWDGTDRKASVTFKGDEFRQVSAPIPSSKGTFVPHVVWKRIR